MSALLGTAVLFVSWRCPCRDLAGAGALWRREWRDAIGWTAWLSVYAIFMPWQIADARVVMPDTPP